MIARRTRDRSLQGQLFAAHGRGHGVVSTGARPTFGCPERCSCGTFVQDEQGAVRVGRGGRGTADGLGRRGRRAVGLRARERVGRAVGSFHLDERREASCAYSSAAVLEGEFAFEKEGRKKGRKVTYQQ